MESDILSNPVYPTYRVLTEIRTQTQIDSPIKSTKKIVDYSNIKYPAEIIMFKIVFCAQLLVCSSLAVSDVSCIAHVTWAIGGVTLDSFVFSLSKFQWTFLTSSRPSWTPRDPWIDLQEIFRASIILTRSEISMVSLVQKWHHMFEGIPVKLSWRLLLNE